MAVVETFDGYPVCETCEQRHLRKLPDGRWAETCKGHGTGGLRPELKGKPCKQFPRAHALRCRLHGGNTEKARGAEDRRADQAKADKAQRRLMATFGEAVGDDRDPSEVIAEQIRWRRGAVIWLRKRVQALDPAALVWGRTREKVGGDDYGVTKEARPSVWLSMYLDAQRDLEKLCLEAMRAGLEERRVRLAEFEGELIEKFIDGVLAELGHNPNDPETAEIVERHLRAVG